MKRLFLILLTMFLLSSMLTACGREDTLSDKIRDLEFTVVATENIPNELMIHMENEKAEVFHKTYSDGDFMYLCVGYGEQESGGYSITVDELYLTSEGVYMDTTLIGPAPGEELTRSKSYPYIVVCTEYMDYPVIFQ